MSRPDSLQDLANTLDNTNTSDGAFHVSRAAFQAIIDQLQHLNRNGDDQDQVIHELRSEISLLKPQVQVLQTENAALRRELEALRVPQREVLSSGPSDTVPLPQANASSNSSSSPLTLRAQNAYSAGQFREFIFRLNTRYNRRLLFKNRSRNKLILSSSHKPAHYVWSFLENHLRRLCVNFDFAQPGVFITSPDIEPSCRSSPPWLT